VCVCVCVCVCVFIYTLGTNLSQKSSKSDKTSIWWNPCKNDKVNTGVAIFHS